MYIIINQIINCIAYSTGNYTQYPIMKNNLKKKKQENKNPQTCQTHRYIEQTGGCQEWRMGEMCEGGSKAQTFGYRMS